MKKPNRTGSARTPQWKSVDQNTLFRCTQCGTEIVMNTAGAEMQCPKCGGTSLVLAQPNSGERVQIQGRGTRKGGADRHRKAADA